MPIQVTLPLMPADIQKILPHRYPFIMLDKVTEFEDGVRIVGYKYLSSNEGFFQGHFPGRPTMPGVLMVEALAQLGAMFAKLSTGGASEDKLIVLAGVDDFRFRRQVSPGEFLRLECKDAKTKRGHWFIGAEASVDGIVVASGQLRASEVPTSVMD